MTALSSTARQILRDRVRKHPDSAALLARRKVNELKKEELLNIATGLGIKLPTQDEIDTANAGKISGASATVLLVGDPTTDELYDELEEPASDDAPEDGAPATAAAPDTIGQEVNSTMALLGSGDFLGFQASLRSLAERANRPDPEPVIRYVQQPAVAGGVVAAPGNYLPNIIAKKTAKELGAQPARTGVRLECTELPVYDAPHAPAVNKGYIWPETTVAVLSVLRRGGNVLLTGPAGTGKSSFAKNLAAHLGRPFATISCHDQTEGDTLVGMTVPDASGGVKWQDGQLTAAIRVPGTVVLIDEPSVARPGALFALQAVLEAGTRRLYIAETGEVVPVAPDVLFILADNTNGTGDSNGAYEATRRLNRATLDRIGITVAMGYMEPSKEADALVAATGCAKALADVLVRFANVTRKSEEKGELSHAAGLRRLIALAGLITDGLHPDMAGAMAIVATAPAEDQEKLKQLWTATVPDLKSVASDA